MPSHRTTSHCPTWLVATSGKRHSLGGFTAERVGKDLKLDLRRPVKDGEMVGDTGIEPVASSV